MSLSDYFFDDEEIIEDCDHLEEYGREEKMYCTLCARCRMVIDNHPREQYSATMNEDGTLTLHNKI